ncbi:hypothetical protein FRC06_011141 [Ceratobasidium sp. 370]|nr:hypothetical protein FRC06_011141 [Ceratobasidium sp. 370]
MKPELLRSFIERRKGVENCIRLLNSHRANVIALDFVRLVRTAHSQGEDINAEMDLSEQLEYQKLLLKAFRAGDYKEVEEHIMRVLNLPEEMEEPHPEVSSEPVPVDDDASLATAFESKYVRGAENTLYEYLERCNKAFKASPQSHYAKFCSIVQSSGTGKSRTLIELKQKGVVVLYMNIRGIKEVNAYPSRDTIPADILTTKLECSEEDYTCRTVAFFTALFRTLKDQLETYAKVHSSREDVIKAWSSDMCKMGNRARTEFFEKLEKQHNQVID